jgi:hypothetical protein
MLVRLESKLEMLVGNFIVWNMASNLMAKCHQTKLLVVEMTALTLSSVKLELENMFPVQFLLTWNQQS